jgi:hypothetical protein
MPGDEIQASPSFNATRAVTIEAGPEPIWPWLVQMGYGRAGFYSYDRIDNDGVPSADHIILESRVVESPNRRRMEAASTTTRSGAWRGHVVTRVTGL